MTTKHKPVKCKHCRKPTVRKRITKKYCNINCKQAAYRVRNTLKSWGYGYLLA